MKRFNVKVFLYSLPIAIGIALSVALVAIIDVRAAHGVQLDSKFKVIEDSEQILDPDTQEPLGSIEGEKIRVKVVHVQESLAIGRTYETYQTKAGLFWSTILPLPLPALPVTRVRALRSSTGSFDENDSLVAIGDRIVELSDQE